MITSGVGENKRDLVLDLVAIPQSGSKLNQYAINFRQNDILCLKFFYRASYFLDIRSRQLCLSLKEIEIPMALI